MCLGYGSMSWKACAVAGKFGSRIQSVGVCTWGVDFGLLGRGNELLGNPYCYRDSRTEGMLERACEIVPRDEIFAQTGVQFLQINTLYQLLAMRLNSSPLLDVADSMLMVPDLFHWLLSGVKVNEMTEASTSQFFDPRRGNWAIDLFERLQLPTRILGTIVAPGTKLGPLLPAVQAATGLTGVEVVVPGSHDTASAVMGVPAESRAGAEPDWCYISSGTWSLMGVETPSPVVTPQCQAQFHERRGRRRHDAAAQKHLRTVDGARMPAVLESSGAAHSWDDLNRLSSESPPLAALVNVNDARFFARPTCRKRSATFAAAPAKRRHRASAPWSAARWKAWPCAIARCSAGSKS